MDVLKLDLNGIHEFQQNRAPYLMIDFANEIIPGVSAKGYKDLSWEDWWFKVHWPGDPNMPGMLQIEALTQLGALTVLTLPGNKGKVVYLSSANNLKFKKKIIPGDRLLLDVKLNLWKRGIAKCVGVGTVDDEIACQADFILIMPDIIKDYKLNKQ